jgi:hypothetical protein
MARATLSKAANAIVLDAALLAPGGAQSAPFPPPLLGARRVSITFDAAYTSCMARVIFGREGGTGPIRVRSRFKGGPFEIDSIQTSAPSCSIMAGNVFGGQ